MKKLPFIRIAPSLLAADFTCLEREIHRAEEAGADLLHVDVMDGHFVPNITLGPFIVEAVKRLTQVPLDVHLMIEEPEKFIEAFARCGADYLTYHLEVARFSGYLNDLICKAGAKPGISVSPETRLDGSEETLRQVGKVLVMTVRPGFGGQAFLEETLPKIRQARDIVGPGGDVQVDGGVDLSTVVKVAEAGANNIVAGTFLFGASDMRKAMEELRRLAEAHYRA